MVTDNAFVTVIDFVKHMHMLGTVPDRNITTKETIGTGNGVNATFWLDRIGVIENTLVLYYGSAETTTTVLTETTHYTFDYDSSKITLTAAGITLLSTNNMYGVYSFHRKELSNNQLLDALNAAEQKVLRVTEQTFANYTDANPGYKKILNEQKYLGKSPQLKTFEMFYQPVVKLQTTVKTAFTLGDTNLELTSASGFPNTGTIYIDGNKVAYTSKSSNTIIVPSTTPSIAIDKKVRGEVIEVSKEVEGVDPSFTILNPDTDYIIDYLQGKVLLFDNAFWGELNSTTTLRFEANYIIRASYMTAWYKEGSNPIIPRDVAEVVYKIAARKLEEDALTNAHIEGKDGISANDLGAADDEIAAILGDYKVLNVGISPYDKNRI